MSQLYIKTPEVHQRKLQAAGEPVHAAWARSDLREGSSEPVDASHLPGPHGTAHLHLDQRLAPPGPSASPSLAAEPHQVGNLAVSVPMRALPRA